LSVFYSSLQGGAIIFTKTLQVLPCKLGFFVLKNTFWLHGCSYLGFVWTQNPVL